MIMYVIFLNILLHYNLIPQREHNFKIPLSRIFIAKRDIIINSKLRKRCEKRSVKRQVFSRTYLTDGFTP